MDCIVSFIFHFPSTSLTAGKGRDGKEKNVAKLRYLCAENVRRVCVVFLFRLLSLFYGFVSAILQLMGMRGGGCWVVYCCGTILSTWKTHLMLHDEVVWKVFFAVVACRSQHRRLRTEQLKIQINHFTWTTSSFCHPPLPTHFLSIFLFRPS